MFKNKNKKNIYFSLVGASLFFLFVFLVNAGNEHNISGYGWSENIGWISFNSNSDGGAINYGVNINTSTGDLSGYAWSENIGWISFNRSVTGNPPAAPFNGGSGPIAQYNSNTNTITGWMKVLSPGDGWDGWIKLYNVTVDTSGDWHGWAWSDIVAGWISFNSVDGGAGGSYKVASTGIVSSSPTANSLTVIAGNYCTSPLHHFSWTYSDPDGDNQTHLQLQLDREGDFASPEFDSGQIAVGSYTCPNSTCDNDNSQTAPVDYNATYYWRVKVWDDQGGVSNWIYPGTATFSSLEHRFPAPSFTWSPQEPSSGEDVDFTDGSVCYDSLGGVVDCVSWQWTFEDATPLSSSLQNPTVQFDSSGQHSVGFRVYDPDGNACPVEGSPLIEIVGVKWGLPDWREILPW
ncbi:MAG: PKD domain-containing protein [Candidatus Marinimicrobia bacterium]|nr:PKD domain-containing protein [Candidatus Neomarinimicrobiota bacterium]